MKFIFVTIKFCFIGILYFISERYSSKIISVAKIKFWFSCHVQHVSNTLRGKCHDNQNIVVKCQSTGMRKPIMAEIELSSKRLI